MSAIVFSSQNKIQKRYFVAILGLSSGLLVMIKLSTILAPVVILIFLNVRKQSVREKLITSGIFLIMAVSPSLTSTISDSNSETSLTWYGLVAYAIEFQSEDPKKLDISEDAEKLLDNALMKRADTWKKYPEVVREYNFTFQKTPISLYYSALPAAQDLGFNESDQTYTSRLFREITISSFMAHKNLALKALGENLLVPLGLFKLDGQYLSMSKVLKNPITYVLFLSVFFRYFSRRSSTDFLFVSMLISFVVINYFVVSIFNGPIPRYFSLYDPLLLYSMIIAFSRCLDQPKENVQ
jgi:4-amino-4-deoxy-L-arabinose transferase-like glycosyltransferase